MKIKIKTNFFCKSNHWSKRMLKIKEIVKNIIKIDDIGFIKLDQRDVIRHEVVRKIINAYEDKN